MNNLVERYVYQVGTYLPKKERAEVQNELRSLIQDQLDDRYKGAPTEDDIVELLTEFGDPRRMAASYSGEQYLIGPELYPIMVRVLQRGWLWIPPLVVLVRVLLAFVLGEPGSLIGLFLETAFAVVQAVLIFSAIVVAIFAIIQHSGEKLEVDGPFDPRKLPQVDNKATVDRGELAFGIAFNIFVALVLVYFLRVGGLTLRFNLSEPVEVLAVPLNWLVVSIFAVIAEILVDALALRRGRWTAGLVLVGFAADLVGLVAGYFVFIQPLIGLVFDKVPALTNLPFAENAPEILAAIIALMITIEAIGKFVKVVFGSHSDGNRAYAPAQPEG